VPGSGIRIETLRAPATEEVIVALIRVSSWSTSVLVVVALKRIDNLVRIISLPSASIESSDFS